MGGGRRWILWFRVRFWKESGVLCDSLQCVGLLGCVQSEGSHFGSRNIGVVAPLFVRSAVLSPGNRLPSFLLVWRIGGRIGELWALCLVGRTFRSCCLILAACCLFVGRILLNAPLVYKTHNVASCLCIWWRWGWLRSHPFFGHILKT